MKKRNRGLSPLLLSSTIIVSMILFPSLLLIIRLLNPVSPNWNHIKAYLLNEYIANSLALIFSVAIFTGLIGTFLSYGLCRFEFKYEKAMNILLYIPMAIPVYIGGYIYGGFFGNFGTIHRIFISLGIPYNRPDIFSLGGSVFVFSLFLSPYVVLISKSFFKSISKSYFDVSKTLGHNELSTFFRVILPMSKGAIISGIILVILEVLNEYGLVKYFGVPTFSTAIYSTWFGLGDLDSAIRLSSILMVVVFIILFFQGKFEESKMVSDSKSISNRPQRIKGSNRFYIIYSITFILYLTFSVLIPIAQLVYWSYLAIGTIKLNDLFNILTNTIIMASAITLAVLFSSLIVSNCKRLINTKVSNLYSRLIILGYSVPASIISIALLNYFLSVDRLLDPMYLYFGAKKMLITSTILLLCLALTIRYMAIGFNSIDSGLRKIGMNYHNSGRILGASPLKSFVLIDLPMLKHSIISALILTFVDVLKELPITLILRPFNFDTLSTKVFTYASDEMIHEASVYALMIISISLILLLILQFIRKESQYDRA